MKRILITGKNSYIGTSVGNWLMKDPDKYEIDTLDLRQETWKDHDFSKYDVVFHVAGITHIKETNKNRSMFFKVNRDLTYEIAKKAKANSVKQFIFLSTMSVYGIDAGVITQDTVPNPKTAYGLSKYEAEELITQLCDDLFKVAILRPPLVYGKGCKGNYSRLSKFAKLVPIFPKIKNERSMIYIDNLSTYVKHVIDHDFDGCLLPQDSAYINTSELVKMIRNVKNKPTYLSSFLGFLVNTISTSLFQRIFGTLIYEYDEKFIKRDFEVLDLNDSIRLTEN